MHLIRLSCIVFVLVASLHAAESPDPVETSTPPPNHRRSDPSTWVWNFPESVPPTVHGEIHSAAMDRTVGYNIYLPPEYESHPTWNFPVVYFLHGASANEKFAADIGKVADAERAAGRTGPVVWVFVNGGPFSSYYDWPDANVKSETLVIHELIPTIESRYRVRSDRAGRAICGYSMGGNGAMRLATKYPDMFCAVNAIAGAFGMGGKLAEKDNVFRWTRENVDRIRGRMPMRFFVGADDALLSSQTTYHALLNELHLGYHYTVIEGKGHMIGDMWAEVVPDFARTIANACADPRSE